MPTISTFYGIRISMFWDDHSPPHFHAWYAGSRAAIGIESLEVLRGRLPRRALALVAQWAKQNRPALLRNWELCRRSELPEEIPGLP